MPISKRLERLVGLLLLAVSVCFLASRISHPIHGNFYFRQAHVAANIEQYVAHGLSLVPSTYNRDIPYALFDFPIYQLLVAALCRTFDLPVLPAARAVNLLVLVLSVLLIFRILDLCGFSRLSRLLAGGLFVLTPMNLFYFHGPMVDPLAILCSLASLYGYLRWEGAPRGGATGYFLLSVTAGVLASLIKSPVYLPVFVGIVAHVLAGQGWRGAVRRETLVFVAAVAAAVVSFKLFSNAVNGVEGFFDESEPAQYFGPLRDRLDVRSWERILPVLLHEAANPLTIALALAGVPLCVLRYRGRFKGLLLGLAGGCFLALLVFFNRYTWHNYYLLPFEFPIALFAGYTVHLLEAKLRLLSGRFASGLPALALPAVVVAVVLPTTWYSFRSLSSTPTDWIRARGEWLQSTTAPDDFVVYVVESEDPADWNPVFLYFAQRYGWNLTTRRVERHPEILRRLKDRFRPTATGRYLVFCPPEAAPRLDPLLTAEGLRLVEAGVDGWLYDSDDDL